MHVRTESRVCRFGPFELNFDRRRLTRGPDPVFLAPRDMEVLLVLVARAGQLVPKETLIVAREALVGRLDAIGRTARAIAEQTPGFDDPFWLPRKQGDAALLTAGQVFVEDAETAATSARESGKEIGTDIKLPIAS